MKKQYIREAIVFAKNENEADAAFNRIVEGAWRAYLAIESIGGEEAARPALLNYNKTLANALRARVIRFEKIKGGK